MPEPPGSGRAAALAALGVHAFATGHAPMLRPGTGYRDLAADLLGYAGIDEKRADDVAADTTNYRATDAADARRLAGEILAHRDERFPSLFAAGRPGVGRPAKKPKAEETAPPEK